MKFIGLLTCCFLLSPLFAQANEGKMNLLEFIKKEHIPLEDLLPAGVTVTKGFEPGTGLPVGEVQEAHGTVFVIHKGGGKAYRLQEKNPIFRGDTLITEHEGGVTILLVDQSALTLTGRSKMLIDRSFYRLGSRAEKRNTKLQLLFGKVRAFVSKITGDSDYTITTPTAVAGVRGTDFALVVGPVSRKPSECERFSQPRSSVSASESEEFVTSLMTALVTGENSSSVELSDPERHSPIIVNSLSITGIMSGCTEKKITYLGKDALRLLQGIGPQIDQLHDMLTLQQKGTADFIFESFRRYLEKKNHVQSPVPPVQLPVPPVQLPVPPVQLPVPPEQLPVPPEQLPVLPVQLPISPVSPCTTIH